MGSVGHNSANTRLKSFIDRVLRLKEEQDALAADIREVYAEAKGEGFDKTAMGNVVSHLRRVEKKGRDAVDEADTFFQTYLDAYERGSHAHAYAREAHEVPGETRDAGESARAAQLEDDEKSGSGESPDTAPQPAEALSEVALPTTGEDTGLSGSGSAPGTGSAGGGGSTPPGAPKNCEQRETSLSLHEAGTTGQATVRNPGVTVVGDESGNPHDDFDPGDIPEFLRRTEGGYGRRA